MEKELNIAEILKDKPNGTKLYSPCCGVCTKGNDGNSERPITLYLPNRVLYHLLGNGKEFESGEIMVYPSKQMRDWEKFAWKKGDVLATDINTYCIFDSWENDAYTQFRAKYICRISDCHFYSDEVKRTCNWTRVKENDIIEYYINIIERSKGGKLNLETLEIEKPQFKDGDIVCFYGGRGCYDAIAIIKEQEKETFNVYTFIEVPIMKLYYQYNNFYPYTRKARLATEEEKQQLFAALEKEGKAWDAEKKQIVDLPKKCEFKPMDWCLMRFRGTNTDTWKLCQFGFIDDEDKNDLGYCAIGGNLFDECIPYNEETKHLLGTTDDYVEGGEG